VKILPLRLNHASFKINRKTLLDDISVELKAGGKTIILGANGAGKSTFLKLCHGLIKPTSGSLNWLGGQSPVKHQAFVFQRPVLLRRSVKQNMNFALSAYGVSKTEQNTKIKNALEQVGLIHKNQQMARSLSIGEQQKLAIARAIALNPEVLFLDEPTASLDPDATADIEALINELYHQGTKIVMATHNLRQAKRLADEVIFLDKGMLAAHQPARDFFHKSQSLVIQKFLS
jgi:tungstate transport system ATP-binding protein